jgi:hypothetical protein
VLSIQPAPPDEGLNNDHILMMRSLTASRNKAGQSLESSL